MHPVTPGRQVQLVREMGSWWPGMGKGIPVEVEPGRYAVEYIEDGGWSSDHAYHCFVARWVCVAATEPSAALDSPLKAQPGR
jgi:hypothetical protein